MHLFPFDRALAALPFLGLLRVPGTKAEPDVSGRELTGERLETLLAVLHDDPEAAALEYQRIREKLIRLFTWNRARFPEDLADRTLDNAAAALHRSGETIRAADKFRYCCSVAFTTMKEALRAERRETAAAEAHTELFSAVSVPSASWTERAQALGVALEELDSSERQLILDYYSGSGGKRIRHRKRMAALLGISGGALRLRTHKLRLRLEDRVLQLLAERLEEGN